MKSRKSSGEGVEGKENVSESTDNSSTAKKEAWIDKKGMRQCKTTGKAHRNVSIGKGNILKTEPDKDVERILDALTQKERNSIWNELEA